MIWDDENLIKVLEGNGVVVMPTDTLYGIVGKALSEITVERIYKLRKRNLEKPCIILIGDINELKKFDIVLTKAQRNEIGKYREPTSFIVDCADEKFSYLHRGTCTLAFRLPASKSLRNFLIKTGPLVAPSANPEGLSPAHTVFEAQEYFGDQVDLYIDGGEIRGKASKIVKLHKNGSASIIRQ
ncbi:MAG: tRNA threonylcarbamoyladenosine biosynthesis protein [Parcubacteria group bacterium Gr01-1014_24]|nr:MAG: tRNA threonylcarbamoyladenosine biosynthesis protein [Parcubacteria group bacterium Gr01-1014_24]